VLAQSVRCARCAIPSSCARTVQQCNSHLDILQFRRVTKSKGYIEETTTFRDTVGTSVSWQIWHPEYKLFFYREHANQVGPGPTQPPICWVPGENRPGREDTHSVHVPMVHRATEAPSAHVSVLQSSSPKPGTHYPYVTWAQLLPYFFPCNGSQMLISIIW
jgi:hypothetical protein